ncbi:MAG: hypothetical protein COB93_12125 [Sneathiella sp.]|nr:MAG: hypothetical protein COB93_12125 [Sneathiella sp.]
MSELFLAGALILFVEGVLYALFPDGMKKVMMTALETPSGTLRAFGLAAAIIGVVLIWFIRG